MISVFFLYQCVCIVVHGANTWITYSDDGNQMLQYMYITQCRGWAESRTYCQSIGGDLASAYTSDQRNFIVNAVYDGTSTNGSCSAWSGALMGGQFDAVLEGSWTPYMAVYLKWFDGTSIPIIRHYAGEPSVMLNGLQIDWDTNEPTDKSIIWYLDDRSVIGFKLSSRKWHAVDKNNINAQICQRITTPYPTAAPTSAPTEAPSPSTPTAQPTLTEKYVYVRKHGCDYGYCNSSDSNNTDLCINNSSLIPQYDYCCFSSPSPTVYVAETCKTIEYSWSCYLGIGGYPNKTGCKQHGYDGNGVFDIGDGVWNFPYQINLDDNNVRIRGKGPYLTTFNYIGQWSKWITCRWHKCWIGLEDLTISSNRTNTNDTQFYMANGGTLYIRNVVFDGNNYNVPQNGEAFWKFVDERVNIEFYDCYFTNNDVMFLFSNKVNAYFENCTFKGNEITLNTGLDYDRAMFVIDDSNLVFTDCMFINNKQINRPLFLIQNHANLSIINTIFMQNIDLTNNTNMFSIGQYEASLTIITSSFIDNHGFKNIINTQENTHLDINNTLFQNNQINTVLNVQSNGQSETLYVINCTFSNNNILRNSSNNNGMFLVNNSNIQFEDCTFRENTNCSLFTIENHANLSINNCTFMRNINHKANSKLLYVSYSSILSVYGSTFKINDGHKSIIESDDAIIIINSSVFYDNNVSSIITANDGNLVNNDQFECISKMTAQIYIVVSMFNNNIADYLVYNYGSNIYIDDDTMIIDNICNHYCIYSLDGSLSINGNNMNSTSNLIQFGHKASNATNNISLCIRNKNNVQFASYLSLRNITKTNAKIIYGECLVPYKPNYYAQFEPIYGKKQMNIYDTGINRADKSLNCTHPNISLCQMYCNFTAGCDSTTFIVNKQNTNILCESFKSCEFALITTQTNDNNDTLLHIICDEAISCQSAQIEVSGIDEFILDCLKATSCINVAVNLSNTITSQISCHEAGSCDNLRVVTDNDNTTVKLYEFSQNILINNSIGYNDENLQCGHNDAYIMVNNEYTTINDSISATIYNVKPCGDVTFICNHTESCIINQYISETVNIYQSFDDFFICYGPVNYQDIINIDCIGTCPQSPTLAPTLSPTLPTSSPSTAPSQPPSTAPSAAPSQPPSIAPSTAPTISPSNNPTYTPSQTPSLSPTLSPSLAPTLAPSFAPSLAPSIMPSLAPSFAPSLTPSFAPSLAPSIAPSNSPSTAPSLAPSISPSAAPSDHPTANPTTAPSSAPTTPPTNVPSTNPSIAPSGSPSQPPSIAPTSPPTAVPSVVPSYSPSTAPSYSPSIAPSISPTLAPSIAPTFSPSLTPTLSPTDSPTTCIDLNENYTTIDGVDVALNPSDFIELVILGNNSDVIIASDFINKYHNCSSEHGCDYYCGDKISCFEYTIDCDNPFGCNIICQDRLSCAFMTIIADSFESTALTVICNGLNSCQNILIYITGISSAHIHCVSRLSCFLLNAVFDEISSRNNSETSVTCYAQNACDNVYISADGPYTKLNLYAHSDDVVLNNNYGYSSHLATITCGLDQKYIKYDFNDQNTIKQLVEAEYPSKLLPCQDVQIICDLNNTIIQDDEDCIMKYIYPGIKSNDPIFDGLSCIYAALYDVVRLQCEGNCLSSPSLPPTVAPSNSPTTSPSNTPTTSPITNPTVSPFGEPSQNPSYSPTQAPSTAPTINPSSAPTKAPSTAPTNIPSIAPSTNPTVSPSQTPSNPPSNAPTTAPTIAPSDSPTIEPSISPSYSPSITPSVAPSTAPSNYPSKIPTANPTFTPSQTPSSSPSRTPSDAPTYSPSIAPSDSPSPAPTQHPITSADFDSFIKIEYLLQKLRKQNIIKLVLHKYNVTRIMQTEIKNAYFDQQYLEYKHFMVHIVKIDGTEIDEINDDTGIKWNEYDTLTLNTDIECDKDPIDRCAFIKQQSQQTTDFANITQTELRKYFDNEELLFSVINPSSLKTECKDCNSHQFDLILMSIGSIVGLIVFTSICAFLYNKGKFPKLPGFNIVDDARWVAWIGFALQFWDFTSDINLSVEIWERDDVFHDFIILIAAIGSSLFILIPYIANIIVASKVKVIIRNNQAAKGWFQHHTPIFTILVVLTGGCHPALSVVSSGIFGLSLMTSGLTEYELKKLINIKLFGTVILENVPQLIFQLIYSYRLNMITDNTALALAASILSITASILSYWIERNPSDTKVVEYYLLTECTSRTVLFSDDVKDNGDNNAENTTINGGGEEDAQTIASNIMSIASVTNGITDDEKENLLNNRGRTKALGFEIAEVFGIAPENIEIGYSMLTKYGVITHIVHYVYDDDLKILQQELNADNVTARFCVEQQYISLQEEINQIFRRHFILNDEFNVSMSHRLGIKQRGQWDVDNNETTIDQMVNQIELVQMLDKANTAKIALNDLFEERAITEKQEKIDLTLQLIDNNEKSLIRNKTRNEDQTDSGVNLNSLLQFDDGDSMKLNEDKGFEDNNNLSNIELQQFKFQESHAL